MKIGAVVLAAGRSERMGRPKALLPCRGRTFLRTILDTLAGTGIRDVRVVLGEGAGEIRDEETLHEEIVVVNARYEEGMLSSVRCGVLALAPDVEGFFLWPVDHPLVRTDTLGEIIRVFEAGKGGIVVPLYDGRRGHPAVFAARIVPLLLSAPDQVGARAVLRDHPAEVAEISVPDPGVVTDIDTPEAYRTVFGDAP